MNRSIIADAIEVKVNKQKGTFECYANTKGNIDRAQDRTMDGCFTKSINNHSKSGTMPSMFWMHKNQDLPVGIWTHMEEDSTGLAMSGRKVDGVRMSEEIYLLAEAKSINKFSIGYNVINEKWNHNGNCNDLLEVDVKEVSWVNDIHACNQESNLTAIKSALDNGGLLSKAEMRELLRDYGLSKRETDRITAKYSPELSDDNEILKLKGLIESSAMFK